MTNAKISKKAKAVLKNKSLSSAIANALVRNHHTAATTGLTVDVNGRRVAVKIASSSSR